MNEQEKSDTRDDCQRAAALVIHHARADLDGINAVLQEAAEADRATQLYLALLDLYQYLVPEVRTELGMKMLGDTVTRLAGMDPTK